MRDARNKDFKLKIRLGYPTHVPEKLYKMKSTEMASDDKKKEREKIIKDAVEALDLDYDRKRMKVKNSIQHLLILIINICK